MLRAGALVLQGEAEGAVLVQPRDKKALGRPKLLEGEGYHKNGARLFTEVHGGTGHKLKQERFRLDVGRNLFPVRTIKKEQNLPRFCSLCPWMF